MFPIDEQGSLRRLLGFSKGHIQVSGVNLVLHPASPSFARSDSHDLDNGPPKQLHCHCQIFAAQFSRQLVCISITYV